jgi:type IV pilus assembly protein PilM
VAIGLRTRRAAVGLDIGTSAVRAAEVTLVRGRPSVRLCGEVPLPPGAVREGEVVDVEIVARAIRELWSSAKPSSKRVALGLANRRTVVRQVELPWLPADELRAALPFHAGEHIPMAVEAALLDFWPLDETVGPGGTRQVRGLLVAVAREAAETLVAAVAQAGLTAASIDILPLAILRALGSLPPAAEAPDADPVVEALVDVGSDVTNVLVHERGRPLFVRMLLLGGSAATEAIAATLGVEFAEAEVLKRGLADMPSGDVRSVLARASHDQAVDELVQEIRGSLQYFAASAATGPVQRLVLSGGGARVDGLAAGLSQAGLPVHLAAGARAAAVPVGLALGSLV